MADVAFWPKACLANRKVLDGIVWVQDRAAKDFNVRTAPTFFFNGKIKVGWPTIGEIEAWLKAAPPPTPGK